jgi:nucleotide-binding universal stress UspA family protein
MFLHRILVPTDFSWRSRRALAWALEACDRRSIIDVVHAAPLARPWRPGDDGDAEEQLRLFVAQSHGRAEPLLEHGDPATIIVRTAVERGADLIVIGTHARTGVAETLLGSVAHQVITCAPCPVVTLRGNEPSVEARVGG